MKAVKNEQYAYIDHVRTQYDQVYARIGEQFGKRYKLPQILHVEDESSTRALVLAPHQDDDVLGCGGTIHLLIGGGARVKVVYMTDGRYGNISISPDQMIRTREIEAREGLRALGVTDAVFHDVSDLGLEFNPTNVEMIKDILERNRPNALFVPHPNENHPDHWTTAQIAAEALKGYDEDITVFQYEVWTSIVPNVLVDITHSMAVKLLALNEHRSQMQMLDYGNKIGGLNAYRSINAGNKAEFCEAFIMSDAKGFIADVVNSGLL